MARSLRFTQSTVPGSWQVRSSESLPHDGLLYCRWGCVGHWCCIGCGHWGCGILNWRCILWCVGHWCRIRGGRWVGVCGLLHGVGGHHGELGEQQWCNLWQWFWCWCWCWCWRCLLLGLLCFLLAHQWHSDCEEEAQKRRDDEPLPDWQE